MEIKAYQRDKIREKNNLATPTIENNCGVFIMWDE